MNLHDFDISHNFLDSIGIPRLNQYANNVIIGRIDLTEQENLGNIDWREDGVYLNVNGNYQKGFMYNKDYLISKFGNPKFHLFKCEVIQGFIVKGIFNGYYYWSNSPTVTVTQRGTHIEYEDETLKLCSKCRAILTSRNLELVSDTEDFHNTLDFQEPAIEPTEQVDIFGRPFNWQKISTAYKKSVDYTCESCGFGGSDLESNYDKRFIDTDHITGWDLTNTDESNLMCLCKLCHAFKDDIHTENFNKRRMRIELKTFVNKYRHILEIKNIGLLNRFDRENE